MKGKPISLATLELAWIEARKKLPRRQLHEEFIRAFGRRDISLGSLKALCKRKGWLTGRTGRFVKGRIPDNKGRKMPYNPNSARTQFKKGNRPHTTKYAGHERVSKDGYILVSVKEANPHTGFERRYVLKHRWLWERVNGAVPEGMVLKCLDGNRMNTDLANWKLVPRAILPRLNGVCGRDYDSAPDELKSAIMAVTEIEHDLRTLAKKGEPA